MDENGKLFDRALYRMRRNRAAAGWAAHDFLWREAALRVGECLDDITRHFPLALDLGGRAGALATALEGKGGVERWITCDAAEAFRPAVICDEEWLPFGEASFDLVASVLSLHHVNDLPGSLIQIRRCLKPGGLFLGILPGAHSFKELRLSVTGASAEQGFPLTPRLSPFVEIRDAGALLMRAGFALPVADSEEVKISYESALRLMRDLRGMGESNLLLSRFKRFTPRSHLAAIADYYHRHFAESDGTVPATFEFITMTGWKD